MTESTPARPVRVTLLTRTSCHLCGLAREAVSKACARTGAGWREVDVDADPELRAEYGDRVPVVLLDGAEFAALQVDRDQLARALSD